MAKLSSFIATFFLAIFLLEYSPSKTEALFVFGFGFFMAIAGLTIKEDD